MVQITNTKRTRDTETSTPKHSNTFVHRAREGRAAACRYCGHNLGVTFRAFVNLPAQIPQQSVYGCLPPHLQGIAHPAFSN